MEYIKMLMKCWCAFVVSWFTLIVYFCGMDIACVIIILFLYYLFKEIQETESLLALLLYTILQLQGQRVLCDIFLKPNWRSGVFQNVPLYNISLVPMFSLESLQIIDTKRSINIPSVLLLWRHLTCALAKVKKFCFLFKSIGKTGLWLNIILKTHSTMFCWGERKWQNTNVKENDKINLKKKDKFYLNKVWMQYILVMLGESPVEEHIFVFGQSNRNVESQQPSLLLVDFDR